MATDIRSKSKRAEIEAQLAYTTTKLDSGRQFFMTALELLADPQGYYLRGNAKVRPALTKVIFSKLYLDKDEAAGVSHRDLADGFSVLLEAEDTAAGGLPPERATERQQAGCQGWTRQQPRGGRRGC